MSDCYLFEPLPSWIFSSYASSMKPRYNWDPGEVHLMKSCICRVMVVLDLLCMKKVKENIKKIQYKEIFSSMIEFFVILYQVVLRNYSWVILNYGLVSTFGFTAAKVACT